MPSEACTDETMFVLGQDYLMHKSVREVGGVQTDYIISIVKDIMRKELRIVKHRPEEHDRVAKRIAKYESYGYKLMEV